MFKRFITTLFCTAVFTLAGCGGGTNILNIQSPITIHSGNNSLDTVTRTIITASAFKSWRPEVAGPGHIVATRRQSGHVAKVNITFSSDSFNISYLDSDNMGYDGKNISPVYGQWVKELRDEIKRRLSAL